MPSIVDTELASVWPNLAGCKLFCIPDIKGGGPSTCAAGASEGEVAEIEAALMERQDVDGFGLAVAQLVLGAISAVLRWGSSLRVTGH